MFLQSLGKYLDYKVELGELDERYAYARETLLALRPLDGRHEYPYLEKPEILEYPTETWPAQDMRKSEVFKYAAKYAEGRERDLFLERAETFFTYVVSTLREMPTRTLARPVVLLLSYGWMHAYFRQHPDVSAPAPVNPFRQWPPPSRFVPQKARAMRRAKVLVAAGAVLVAAAAGALLFSVLR